MPNNNTSTNNNGHQPHIMYGKTNIFAERQNIPTISKHPHRKDLRNPNGDVIGDVKDIKKIAGHIRGRQNAMQEALDDVRAAFFSGKTAWAQQAIEHALSAGVNYKMIQKIRTETQKELDGQFGKNQIIVPPLPPPPHIFDPYQAVLEFVEQNPTRPICEFLINVPTDKKIISKKLVGFLSSLAVLQQKLKDKQTPLIEIEQYASKYIRNKFGQSGYRLTVTQKICRLILNSAERPKPKSCQSIKIGLTQKQ